MEVSRLSSDLKYVEINGVTINLEERSRIDLACMQLDADINQGTIYFWGKIRGKSSDKLKFEVKFKSRLPKLITLFLIALGTIMDYFVVYTLTHSLTQ